MSWFFSFKLLPRVGAMASLAVIVWMSVVPGGSRPTVEISGLLIGALGVNEHIFGYAVCGGLFALGFPHWRAALIVGALACSRGRGLEIEQSFVPDRTAKVSDAALSTAGAALGVYLAEWLRPYWEKRLDNLNG